MTNQPIKANLFNFVLYVHDRERAEYLQGIMHRILEKFPCFVIIIFADTKSKTHSLVINKEIKTLKTPLMELNYQQVTIEASGTEIKKVPLAIYPNLFSDLPTYLLWGVPPTQENTILPELQRYAKCVIFDTDSVKDFSTFGKQMLKIIDERQSDLIDMNWARCGGWRHVIAQVFDCPERVETLKKCKSIQITYNDTATTTCHNKKIQALYLQSWLAAQLEWDIPDCEETDKTPHLVCEYKKNKISIEILPVKIDTFSPGAVAEIKVIIDEEYYFAMTRNKDSPDLVHTYVFSHDSCELPFICHLPTVQRSFSFIQDILYNPSYEHYTRMLKNLALQYEKQPEQTKLALSSH